MAVVAFLMVAILVGRTLGRGPLWWRALLWSGATCLALAAWGMVFPWSRPGKVVVMVDQSLSTRTAAYHDSTYFNRTVARLLGRTPFEVRNFADGNTDASDLVTTDRTTFTSPADAAAVLLFSDGQFELPASAPPTFAVVDPALSQTNDARVSQLIHRGNRVIATISNQGDARHLSIGSSTSTIGPGERAIAMNNPGADVSAQLNAADAWPENDSVRLARGQSATLQRWTIGAPVAGWEQLTPEQLLSRRDELIDVEALAIASGAVDETCAPVLSAYVNDLGGTLILQGDPVHFPPSVRRLSALSDVPPTSPAQWIILLDASGSMATHNRWPTAVAAARTAIPFLPDNATIRIAAFNDQLRPLATLTPESRDESVSFNTLAPGGPTRLQQALEALSQEPGDVPTRILLLSDADADIQGVETLSKSLQSRKISLFLLATAPVTPNALIRALCEQTGGAVIEENDLEKWSKSMVDLANLARGDRGPQPASTIAFSGDLSSLSARSARPWFNSWLKSDARALTSTVPMAARRTVGLGTVASFAFALQPDELDAAARAFSSRTSDPRVRIRWNDDTQRIRIELADAGQSIHGVNLIVRLANGSSSAERDIPEIGPGQYAINIPRSTSSTRVAIRWGDRVIARHVFAGRYAPEFEAIGMNISNLTELAHRTGGAVVPADQRSALDLPKVPGRLDLTGPLVLLGLGLLGLWAVLDRAPYLPERWGRWLRQGLVLLPQPRAVAFFDRGRKIRP